LKIELKKLFHVNHKEKIDGKLRNDSETSGTKTNALSKREERGE
jgi:hypothetical protein